MKKTAIATTALLAVTLFSTVAPAVHAADVTKETKGDVNFTESTVNGGALDLVKAPSVDFGDQEISGTTATYDQSTVDGIQVDDNRGSNVGWNLSVSNTEFTGLTTTGAKLNGAKLTLTNGAATNLNGTTYAPTPAATVALDGSGTAVPVMDAKINTGMGVNNLAVTKASLEVPGTATKLKEKYESTITWTLKDAAL
ncbi:WxL domain-containing protein [Dellaglioa algida]|uniref:WxL domain-containing protein n=1 Tax=Dellaglioa algida TaxID=105612 RepID=UPI000BDBCF8C|nr:WxL domain-containing protein [Dellaglioa algida]MDK1718816.1 WxL domain-containing protein [Dellaglioa algida]MDK1728251.1 WxL domain-containing protein [Dellaglioa algida]MDK1730034.1 WxL domain-containing protein [Dellaglioa algida]MDK1735925.1 WxL domain-containing protein [Dellaglioa algida]MDK1737613.1 WxL domain-containing protein [Dellaglioa algida]